MARSIIIINAPRVRRIHADLLPHLELWTPTPCAALLAVGGGAQIATEEAQEKELWEPEQEARTAEPEEPEQLARTVPRYPAAGGGVFI